MWDASNRTEVIGQGMFHIELKLLDRVCFTYNWSYWTGEASHRTEVIGQGILHIELKLLDRVCFK
jgi:hypothetical protein